MRPVLIIAIAISALTGGCLTDTSPDSKPASLDRLLLTNCEIAYSQDVSGERVEPGVSSWEPRSNPILALAALQILDCEKVNIGNKSFLEEKIGIFYRFDANPPESCLKYSNSFPAILKGILTESSELAVSLSEFLKLEVKTGSISKPTPSQQSNYEWSTTEGSGVLSQAANSDFESDATYQDDFFWETTRGLGYLSLSYQTLTTGSNEGMVFGQVSWPDNFAPSQRPWIGSDYDRHRTSPSTSTAQFADTNCEELIA